MSLCVSLFIRELSDERHAKETYDAFQENRSKSEAKSDQLSLSNAYNSIEGSWHWSVPLAALTVKRRRCR
eukprot:COSAG03_NODE_413_length_8134_cov_3.448164_3_plen_70_part_00